MQKKELLNLINRLGIQAIDIADNWIRVSCPLADINHQSKRDNNPSAGFLINDNGPSVFNCFVCGKRSMDSILNTYKWKKGVDLLGEYVKNEVPEQEQSISYIQKFQEKLPNEHIPDYILNLFDPIENVKTYLDSRNIDLDIAKQHGLLFCKKFVTTKGQVWENAIVTPIRDLDLKTYWIHFRSIFGKKFWHGKPEDFGVDIKWGRKDSFYGMEFLDITKPVVLVEGAFDVLRLKTLGVENVIGTHGGIGKDSEKIKRLVNMKPKSIYLGFDADDAGRRFQSIVRNMYDGMIYELDWKLVGCKDPGDLKTENDLIKVSQQKQRNFRFRDKFRSII